MPPKVQKRKRNVLSIDEEREIIAKIQKGDAVPAWDRFFNSNLAPQTSPPASPQPGYSSDFPSRSSDEESE